MDNLLHIDPALMREAQRQARHRNINLSEAVEAFIRRFISEEKEKDGDIRITPFVARLGADLGLPPDFDEKEAYRKHLEEKCTAADREAAESDKDSRLSSLFGIWSDGPSAEEVINEIRSEKRFQR